MDKTTTFAQLKEEFEKFVTERDWAKYHHPKEVAISLVLEAAELLEIFQWEEKQEIPKIKSDNRTMQRIKEEISDIILYCISIANRLDIDISTAIREKLELNKKKYPADVVKGKSTKYTEYK